MDIELCNDRIPRNPVDRQFLDMGGCRTRNEFKLGTRRVFNDFCGKIFRIHAFKVTNTTYLISLETGDKMLCITYIHNSIL